MTGAVAILGADQLAHAASRSLERRGLDVLTVRSDEVADVALTLRDGHVALEGRRIGAMLLRMRPGEVAAPFGFVEEDRGFVHAEIAATLLATTHAPSMLAINRLDAQAWFEHGQWTVWRRRLAAAGVAVTPMSVGHCDEEGAAWRPYGGGPDRPVPAAVVRRMLGTALALAPAGGAAVCVFGEPLTGPVPAAVRLAAARLAAMGVVLATITFDADGGVALVDPFPVVPDPLLGTVVDRLTDAIDDHLHSR